MKNNVLKIEDAKNYSRNNKSTLKVAKKWCRTNCVQLTKTKGGLTQYDAGADSTSVFKFEKYCNEPMRKIIKIDGVYIDVKSFINFKNAPKFLIICFLNFLSDVKILFLKLKNKTTNFFKGIQNGISKQGYFNRLFGKRSRNGSISQWR